MFYIRFIYERAKNIKGKRRNGSYQYLHLLSCLQKPLLQNETTFQFAAINLGHKIVEN